MHMSDALISGTVGAGLLLVSGGFEAKAIRKVQEQVELNRLPMMGVMGAFVFAAQMINFAIPGTGSSGHIGGGVLLAALLGPYAAFITMSAVLLIQALFFGDGGLLAYGCNLFNMGVLTCFVVYPLIFKPLLKNGINTVKLSLASVLTVVIGLQMGAFSVVLETMLSNNTNLPFTQFVILMQPIHLAIGLVEGLITAAILHFLWQARPELLQVSEQVDQTKGSSLKSILTALLLISLITGGVFSQFASADPDGLEWSIQGVTGEETVESESVVHQAAASLQEITAFMPDYSFRNSESLLGTSLSGIIGSLTTLLLLSGMWIVSKKRKQLKIGSEQSHE